MTVKFQVISKDVKEYFNSLDVDMILHNLDKMEEGEEK